MKNLWKVSGAVALGLVAAVATSAPSYAVIGGAPPAPGAYPSYFGAVTAFYDNGTAKCGGSLIAADVILTAAHCVHGSSGARVVIGAGDNLAFGFTEHPLYDGDTSDGHDLALIYLAPGATGTVTPIQAGAPWDAGAYFANTPATIMGKGVTSTDGAPNAQLLLAQTTLRSDSDMSDLFDPWWGFDHWNEPLMIGAGTSAHTVCNGDSGGPLVVDRGHPVQVGVASFAHVSFFGTECDDAAGFAELANAQLAWLAQTVPSIVPGWGSCLSPTGSPGTPHALYGTTSFPGAKQDGNRWWSIWCEGAPATVKVPDLRGESVTEAKDDLAALGLHVGGVGLAVDNSCELINLVMAQSPAPGTVVSPGSGVNLTVGKRPKNPCP
ncbi:trypsin-like serine protease [Dactylosporangium siamense]|nr:trypsin-like serine protease [Dactylosporangium siamense]